MKSIKFIIMGAMLAVSGFASADCGGDISTDNFYSHEGSYEGKQMLFDEYNHADTPAEWDPD